MNSIVSLSIIYYFLANTIYIFLLGAAVFTLWRQSKVQSLLALVKDSFSTFAPRISILAPAYNEQENVVESTKSFLMLNYPSFEVVVINDGSKDETLKRLTEAFVLEPAELLRHGHLSKTEIRRTYRSRIHPNLVVIDKVNGGKADALNVGLDFAANDVFCAVDSDSLLEGDALLKVALPFMENPDETIACGGTVRIANGATVKFGRVESIGLSNKWLVLMQVVEYTRAFLCGRIGWNALNSTLVISGAFGLFSRQAVSDVGGYTAGSIGEDMELVLRLHRKYRGENRRYSVVFVPDPVCWTEAPETFSSLQKQRDRWQRGLAESLIANRNMLFNPKYGALGMIAIPYFVFVELLGPVIELFSLTVLFLSFLRGELDLNILWLFFVVSLLYGTLLSIASVLIEEVYFSKYERLRHFITLFGVCMIESFGYRQISSVWRLIGLYKYVRGDNSWGHLQRMGLSRK